MFSAFLTSYGNTREGGRTRKSCWNTRVSRYWVVYALNEHDKENCCTKLITKAIPNTCKMYTDMQSSLHLPWYLFRNNADARAIISAVLIILVPTARSFWSAPRIPSNFRSMHKLIVLDSKPIRFVRRDPEHAWAEWREVCESQASGNGHFRRSRFLVLTKRSTASRRMSVD